MGKKKDARLAKAAALPVEPPPEPLPVDAGTPEEPAQTAELEVRIGRHAALRLRLRLTPAGIGAIAGLVSGILLSTAVVVHAARREERRDPLLPR